MEWHEVFKGVENAVPAAVVEEEEQERAGLLRRLRAQPRQGARHAARPPKRPSPSAASATSSRSRSRRRCIGRRRRRGRHGHSIVEELERRAAVKKLSRRREPLSTSCRRHGRDAATRRPGGPADRRLGPAERAAGRRRQRHRQDDDDRQARLSPQAARQDAAHGRRRHVPRRRRRAARQWAQRVGCDIVKQAEGGDPAAVVYDGVAAARSRGADVVLIDTAGRLHTQVNLMSELEKVRRVIEKQMPGAPHETLLVLDATTGQNGLRQAQEFQQAVDVSGIVLTKLDGTAKGGIVLAIHEKLGIPIKLIGVGEKLEDLRPFDADDFARAILRPRGRPAGRSVPGSAGAPCARAWFVRIQGYSDVDYVKIQGYAGRDDEEARPRATIRRPRAMKARATASFD